MSDNQPFDDYVRQRLGQYSPEVPPHIWQQIATRNEDKKPRGFWMLRNNRIGLLAVGLLLLGGMATYWATRMAPNSFDGVPKAVATNSAAANPAAPAAPSNSAAANEPANPAAQNGASTGTVAANDLSASPTVDVPTVKKPLATQQGMVDAAPNDGDGNAGVAVPEAVVPADKKGLRFGPSPTNRFIKTRLGQTGQPFKKMTATATANTDGAAASPESGSGGEAVQGQQPLGGLFSKPYGPAQRLYSSKAAPGSLQTRGLTGLTVPDCPSIEDDAAGNKKYFEAYAGPDLGLSSFGSFQNDSSSNRYLQKRKETLRFTSAFSMGLRYTRVFKNGMSIRSGINYSQINERFRYVNERDIRYILVITPRDINVGGNIVTVFDTLRYTQNGTRIKTTYNRYRQIDIPLQLGYEFGNGRLHTNVSAGAIINLYSWQRGDMLDSTLRPVSITTGKGSSSYGFKTNMGVGFLGSVSVYYKLTTRLHALAEPYFRYNLQPMTRDNQNVTQKYSTLGVRLGLRWDLK